MIKLEKVLMYTMFFFSGLMVSNNFCHIVNIAVGLPLSVLFLVNPLDHPEFSMNLSALAAQLFLFLCGASLFTLAKEIKHLIFQGFQGGVVMAFKRLRYIPSLCVVFPQACRFF